MTGYIGDKKISIRATVAKIFTIVCVFCPVLGAYSYHGIRLTEILFCGITLFEIARLIICREKIRFTWALLPVLLLMLGKFIDTLLVGGSILGMARGLFNILIAFVFLRQYIDAALAQKVYKYFAIAASIMGIVQLAVGEIFKIYIPGMLPWGNAAGYNFAVEMNAGALKSGSMTLRPRSFFNEPSDFGMFVGICLLYILTKNSILTVKEAGMAVLFSMAQVCVRSSTGILLTALAWGIFCIRFIYSRRTIPICYVLLLCLLIGAIGFCYTDTFQIFVQRTFQFNSSGGTMGRIGGYFEIFDIENQSVAQIFLGHRVGDTSIFVLGWGLVYWYFGIVGILAYVAMFVVLYKKAVTVTQRRSVILIIFLAIFLASFFDLNEIFYYALYFVCGYSKKKIRKEGVC